MVKISTKVFAVAWLLCISQNAFAQLTDDFSDGDFTNNPAWSGDAGSWQVVSGQLNSTNATAGSTFYLSTPSASALNSQWEIYMELKFSTSSLNYIDISLTSDSANVNDPLNNGYFVRVGGTSDEISLYKKTAGVNLEIIDGTDGRSQPSSSDNKIHIKVVRNASGQFSLSDDNTGSGLNFYLEGTVADNDFTASSYFGISVTQSTSSFFGKHYFDDVYAGPIILDTILPTISQLLVISSTQLDVKFSEPVEQLSSETEANYSVNNGIGSPSSAVRDVSDASLVHLTFATNFGDGVLNTLNIDNIADLAGNQIAANSTAMFTYFAPVVASPNDIVINEILFAPYSGHDEFVELYNRSNKTINLKDLKIADVDTSDAEVIAPNGFLLLPGKYVVITEDSNDVCSQYSCLEAGAFIQNSSLPSFNNDEDDITIIGDSGIVIDKFHYSEDFHFALLQDPAGISLERLSAERTTQDSTNWHSAAQSAGFATPGYKNSQAIEGSGSSDEITITPEIFSPDNDGSNDVVSIEYNFSSPGYVANVSVYDVKGRKSRSLVKNELLGLKGAFSWDGINDRNEKAATGIYLIFVEVFNAEGKVKEFKKTCVLATKL